MKRQLIYSCCDTVLQSNNYKIVTTQAVVAVVASRDQSHVCRISDILLAVAVATTGHTHTAQPLLMQPHWGI
jgi:hypothetical protein